MLTRERFRGPWAGLPVAWNESDGFDEATYRSDVRRCCKAGVPGVYTGGTTGEHYAMEFDEFAVIARATVEECQAAGTPAMIGCTAPCTRSACRRAEYAAAVGASAVQCAFPYWLEIADDMVVPFLHDVAHASGGLPLSLYDTNRSKKTLTIDQHRAIKDAIPQYLMVKSTSDTCGATPQGCAALSEFLNVFVAEPRWAELGPLGAAGWCSSAVYWGPRFTLGVWDMVERKDWPGVEQGCAKLAALFAFIFRSFADRGLPDTALDRIGTLASGFLRTSLRNRAPYPSATPEDIQNLRRYYLDELPEMLDHAI